MVSLQEAVIGSDRHRRRHSPLLKAAPVYAEFDAQSSHGAALRVNELPETRTRRLHSRSSCAPSGSTNLAQVRPMRHRPTHQIDRVVADDQVEIGAVGAEGIVGVSTNLGTVLPPSMLTTRDVRRE
jgi:hypothetical protein